MLPSFTGDIRGRGGADPAGIHAVRPIARKLRGLVDKENDHSVGPSCSRPKALSRNYYTKIISVSSISALVD